MRHCITLGAVYCCTKRLVVTYVDHTARTYKYRRPGYPYKAALVSCLFPEQPVDDSHRPGVEKWGLFFPTHLGLQQQKVER